MERGLWSFVTTNLLCLRGTINGFVSAPTSCPIMVCRNGVVGWEQPRMRVHFKCSYCDLKAETLTKVDKASFLRTECKLIV